MDDVKESLLVDGHGNDDKNQAAYGPKILRAGSPAGCTAGCTAGSPAGCTAGCAGWLFLVFERLFAFLLAFLDWT